jgi:PAS domain S-box-containing protein
MILASGIALLFAFLSLLLLLLKRQASARAQQAISRSRALEQEGARMTQALIASEVGLWEWDVVRDAVQTDATVCEQFGLKGKRFPEKVEGFLQLLDPKDRKKVEEMIQNSLERGLPFHAEYRVVWPDGSRRTILSRGRCYYNEEGQPVKMAGCTIDVTERKQLLRELMTREEEYRIFMEMAREWVWSTDAQGILMRSNPAVQGILGYDVGEMTGKGRFSYVIEEDRASVEQALSQKQGWKRLVVRWRGKDGRIVWLESAALPVLSDEGTVIGLRGVDADVTAEMQAESGKRMFVSLINRELRAPLASVRGALGLLAGGAEASVPGRQEQLLEITLHHIDRLLLTIQNILDIEQIQTGTWQGTFLPLDVRQLVLEGGQSYTNEWRDKNITFSVEPVQEALFVCADRSLLLGACNHVFSDVAKGTQGQEAVRVTFSASRSVVRIAIATPPLGEETSCLGVSMSRQAVERLGGAVSFDVKKGERAVISWDLPLWSEALVRLSPARPPPDAAFSLLTRDAALANHLCFVFREKGFHLEAVATATQMHLAMGKRREGLLFVDAAAAEGSWNGYPCIVIRREQEAESARLLSSPSYLLGALGSPLDVERLLGLIAPYKEKRVLYVEEDLEQLAAVMSVLGNAGSVAVAGSFKEAEERYARTAYDLIIANASMGTRLPSSLLHGEPVLFLGWDWAKSRELLRAFAEQEVSNAELVALAVHIVEGKG